MRENGGRRIALQSERFCRCENVKDFKKVCVLHIKGAWVRETIPEEHTMTNMSEAEFEQLLRSINQQPDPQEKSYFDATKQALQQRLACLFEKPLPTEGPPALK